MNLPEAAARASLSMRGDLVIIATAWLLQHRHDI